MFNYNELYMPCWTCPYGHNCKYYSDSLWDQWILENKDCPAKYYTVDSIYTAARNLKSKEVSKLPFELN